MVGLEGYKAYKIIEKFKVCLHDKTTGKAAHFGNQTCSSEDKLIREFPYFFNLFWDVAEQKPN